MMVDSVGVTFALIYMWRWSQRWFWGGYTLRWCVVLIIVGKVSSRRLSYSNLHDSGSAIIWSQRCIVGIQTNKVHLHNDRDCQETMRSIRERKEKEIWSNEHARLLMIVVHGKKKERMDGYTAFWKYTRHHIQQASIFSNLPAWLHPICSSTIVRTNPILTNPLLHQFD